MNIKARSKPRASWYGSAKASEATSENAEDHVPEFGVPFLDLFGALYELYRTPALGQAYLHAMKVFQAVEKGQEVNPSDLTEACRYRVALEMTRVRINDSVSASARKVYQLILRCDFTSAFLSGLVLFSVLSSFILTSCFFSFPLLIRLTCRYCLS